MKLPNFLNPSAESLSKNGHDFSNKVVQELKLLSKSIFIKNVLHILNEYFLMKENQKDSNHS